MLSTITGKVRAIPPVGWVSLVAIAGVAYLMWHNYARDDSDHDWTTPKETQPPQNAPLGMGPAHGSGAPMECNPAFRGRCYPGTLADSHTSIIGTF